MFAIIETGGKQYKVAPDMLVKVEKLEVEAGKTIEFDALLTEVEGKVTVGNPTTGVKVKAEVLGNGKAKKIVVYKYKAKKNVRRKMGHRQPFTLLKVVSIG